MENLDPLELLNKLKENTELKPNILDEKEIKVFNGSENVKHTIYHIDAGSNLKINMLSRTITGQIDIYKLAYYTLKYKVKGINDVHEFLSTNPMYYVNNIVNEINKFENSKVSHLRMI